MRTLYVSDLDGTLLRSDERTSAYTNATINALTEQGVLFSYATARSLVTARRATQGLTAKIPLIVYNGTYVMDNTDGRVLLANAFDAAADRILDALLAAGVCPIVYAWVEGVEHFSWWPERCSRAALDFLNTRRGDVRAREVHSEAALRAGERFYFTCIDEEARLAPLYERLRHEQRCLYQRDIYTGEQWLEILPQNAGKANAARLLKQRMGCDRLVAFGDGLNDLELFDLADECYATANAHEALQARATAVIGSNDEDGVARWLAAHAVPALT